MQIRGSFRFHSVGQGLFYSGLLQKKSSGNSRRFSFVYDCGTTSSQKFLRREADDFKELLPTWKSKKMKRLDLLIVSHLHKDHVNGLEYLLKNVEVDTVVMPYTDQAIRLLAWAESLTEFSDEEEFLREFYANPEGWFSARGVHRIMLIGAPRDNDYREYEAFSTSPNQGRIRMFGEEEGFGESGDFTVRLDNDREDSEGIWIKPGTIFSETKINDTKLLMFDKSQEMKWSHYWIFRFSNLGLPVEREYKEIVERYLTKKKCSLLDIFYSREKTMDLAAKLQKILKYGTTINRTSLVTVHEPVVPKRYYSFFKALIPVHIGRSFDMEDTAETDETYSEIGEFFEKCRTTVLTGDIEITNKEEAKELGLDKIKNCKVFQYPHHGAGEVLPLSVEKMLCRYALTVFSAGITNRYGHPDPYVVEEKRFSIIVNERNAVDYDIIVL